MQISQYEWINECVQRKRSVAPPNSAAIPLLADGFRHGQVIDIERILTKNSPFGLLGRDFSLLAGNVMGQHVLWERTQSA
jgi:hypothetical protein